MTSRLLKDLALELAGPLTCLFNKSWASGQFPEKWKMRTSLLFTNLAVKTLSAITGVLLCFVFAKGLERCVFPRIYNQVVPHLNSLQHGFSHHRSCVTQMIQYVHFLASTLDSGGEVDTIYLDMAKVFDRVTHQKLLYKLRYLGFRDPLLSWIEDYLTNRRHRVTIEGMAFQWKPVTSGVPQGSMIGPILFLIYVNDIGSDISTDSLLHLFADDAKLCRAITTHIDCSILEVDISSVNTWCETWDMNVNPIKCKHLRTTKKGNSVRATYTTLVPMS